MGKRVTEPALPKDSMSPGDTIVGHEAAFYRDGSLNVSGRPRPGVPGYDRREPAAPDAPRWPMLGVAAQVQAARLRELEAAKARLEREIARSVFGADGQPLISNPGMAQMRRDQEAALELLTGQIEHVRGLRGDELRAWAFGEGYR